MKVFEFDFNGEKEWVAANTLEEAKQCLMDMTSDFEEYLADEKSSVKELTEDEMKTIQIIDLEHNFGDDEKSDSIYNVINSEPKSKLPYSVGSTNY